MSSSGNEIVDGKEVGNDVDETLKINLNDELVEGEAKGPPVVKTQESTENGVVKTVEIDSVIDKKIVEAEERICGEKIAEIPDVKSAETSVGGGDDDASKAASDSNVQANTEVDANGIHDEYFNVKLKSEDIVKEGANEVIADMDSKENEESLANVSNEKSSPVEFEDDGKGKDDKSGEALKDVSNADVAPQTHIKEESSPTPKLDEEHVTIMNTSNKSYVAELYPVDEYESGTEEEQTEFANEVKAFYRENNLEYKAPKFYKEDLNLLKLWRAVIKLGGYEQVTSSKLWRQVGESFRPPKTCTTVSWTFRIFYEKALLEYEKHKMRNGELPFSDDSLVEPVRVESQLPGSQIVLGSGRARRDAAARAMQGWHSQRLLGNGEVCQPIIKDKNLNSALKGDKQLKTNGLLKRKKPSTGERGANVPHMKSMRMDSMVIDIGPPADWVKVNVQKTSDCFEIYALVPGLLREEVHVQSDPAGRLIISGEPEHPDNPWGVTPFKKVVSLPSRIDPHQTSAVVTLHGQLFVRVPFEQLDN
ncbi:AT-rich interactive domain-containing protein 5-like [Euphorbia lathyris]|uniref:AT-rich interactive domain-containing protein 5-like n=1 Tax=Euphorbia lathyris TaxID=212925 RepID=UPI0033135EA9